MSAPGRTWHGYGRNETGQPQLRQQGVSELRQQVESLLSWAEANREGTWELAEEERAFLASISELFGVSVPLATFQSAERAASFLRVVALALEG
jgi:hypothetical protein